MKELLLENLSNRAQQYINRHLDEFSVDYYEDKTVNAPDIVNFIQSFQEQMNFERAITLLSAKSGMRKQVQTVV